MEHQNIIEVVNVSKKFGSHEILKDVNLTCEPGKIYGFVGYNGSGKTVLFKCICGLLRVDTGKILVRGKAIGEELIQDTGIIIEHPAFLMNLSGRKNLELLYMLDHNKDRNKIRQVMEQVGLDADSRKKVRQYSLGMRQRLAIAQAIMENPGILILDEPMNGLDKRGIQEVREILLNLKQEGKVILLASHNREDIEILCDKVYEMDNGKLQERSSLSGRCGDAF